jgi:hypothetical protein
MDLKHQLFNDLENILEKLEVEDVKSMEIMFTVRQRVRDIELHAKKEITEQIIKNPPHAVRDSVLKMVK